VNRRHPGEAGLMKNINNTIFAVLAAVLLCVPMVGVGLCAEDISQSELLELVQRQSRQIEQLQQEVALLKEGSGESIAYQEKLRDLVRSQIDAMKDNSGEDSQDNFVSELFRNIEIHGFVSQGYLKSSRNEYLSANTRDGSTEFDEIGVNFTRQLTNKLHVGVQLFARDLGSIDNNKVTVDWAYGDYHWQDWLGLRVGKIKIPLGLHNKYRDVDLLRTWILLPQMIYLDTNRDSNLAIQGVSIYGHVPVDILGSIDYEGQWGTSSIDTDSGTVQNAERSGLIEIRDIHTDYAFDGNIIWNTPFEGLRVGGSALWGRSTMDTVIQTQIGPPPPMGVNTVGMQADYDMDNQQILILSGEYTLGDLVLAGEYMNMTWDSSLGNLFDAERMIEGFYASAAYRLTEWFELGTYYGEYYPNYHDKSGDSYVAANQPDFKAWHKDWALTARFDLSENWIFKLEGHFIDGAANTWNEDDISRKWFLLAAKVTFSF